ncbi:MAG: HAMP domain-containing protein [Deltaproteobacteria bacterium]|nr:HAMP domain-containing protein [Deltaproteobacteria bacterium]
MGGILAEDIGPSSVKRSWRNGLFAPRYQVKLIGLFSLHALLVGGFLLALNEVWLVSVIDRFAPEVGSNPALPEDFGPAILQIVHQLSATVILYMLLCIILGTYLAHRTAGPMYRLSKALEEVEAGRLTTCVFRSKDEAQGLARAFNAMVETLRSPRDRPSTKESPSALSAPARRSFRSLWIAPRFQAKYLIFGALNGVMLTCFYFAFVRRLLLGPMLSAVSDALGSEAARTVYMGEIDPMLGRGIALAVAGLVLSSLASIVFSHRTAGPQQRLRACFDAVAGGQIGVRCQLRAGDHLAELAAAFNRAMEAHELRAASPSGDQSDHASEASRE